MLAAAATTGGLAGETAGHAAQAAAVGAVFRRPRRHLGGQRRGKIIAYAEHVAAMLGVSSMVKGLYGTSVGMSSATYNLADLMGAASIGAII